MGKLVEGDDELLVEDVGEWIAQKHELLCDYIQISTYARRKYLPPGLGGATYIDLFCGPGRAMVRDTGQFVDGGCVAAWRKSVQSGAPFSKVIIGDIDKDRLELARRRLEREHAPVVALLGSASETAQMAVREVGAGALNFAYLDPYSIGALDFTIITTLARLYRIDIMVHVSQMDLQRNFDRNSVKDVSALDAFAPGWRDEVDLSSTQRLGRHSLFEYWRRLVASTGVSTNTETRLITAGNRPLYLLLLAARHELAHKFWRSVVPKDDGQMTLGL